MTEFKNAMRDAGLEPPDHVEPGRFHRFPGVGKRGTNRAGWCILFADGEGGVFGDWSTGLKEVWQRCKPTTPEERNTFRRKVNEAKARAEKERKIAHQKAAKKAVSIWESSSPADEHPYLARKNVKPHGIRAIKGRLVIPLKMAGHLQSLEFIDADGTKRFLRGGRKKHCCYVIGDPGDAEAVCIAEGFATAASIHEATGYAAVVAFDAGNLESVAMSIRGRLPDSRIIVCGDNDDSRTGQHSAKTAAQAVDGLSVIPPQRGDFNDMAVVQGLDAVRRHIKASIMSSSGETGVNLVPATAIEPKPVEWLWEGWLAAGKLHVMAGRPGTGKTTLALALASTLTVGGTWPDGSSAKRGSVLIWSGEDDPRDTLVPRLMACGAAIENVDFVESVRTSDGPRPFDPSKDVVRLRDQLRRVPGVRLLIVDPIVSAVAGDGHKNTEVRRDLQPLCDLAIDCGCAVLGISHFSKGTGGKDPLERVTGSLAFGAAPRLVHVTGDLSEQWGGGNVLVRAKSNIGPDGEGYQYELDQHEVPGTNITTSRIMWGKRLEGSAYQILNPPECEGDDADRQNLAEAFLHEYLKDGPAEAKEGTREAIARGISKNAVLRARKRLGITSRKSDMDGGWVWHPPTDWAVEGPGPQDAGSSGASGSSTTPEGHDDLKREGSEAPAETTGGPEGPQEPEELSCDVLEPSEQRLPNGYVEREI